jgi:hypothetical protein
MQERTLFLAFESMWQKILDFLPSFVAAVVLIIIGLVLSCIS